MFLRFDGEWLLCDDGISRPIMRCEIRGEDNRWRAAEFLLDTGADRTVFSESVLAAMDLNTLPPGGEIRGVGGIAATVALKTQIRMSCEDNAKVIFRGEFVGCRDKELLDMSVLGRDVTQLFAVIVDRPGNRVCLVGHGHGYSLQKQ